jgi:hypothetical protein
VSAPKSDPQTEALSQRLLAPLVNWRDRPAKPVAADPATPTVTIDPIAIKATDPTH